MGHALDNTMQDIIIRFKRMQGYEALWVPGTDHASISTEVKVTNALKEEGIDKHELGREGFLKRTWEWKKEYGGTITSQLKKIGSSCDWDRERFTMDDGCSKAVLEVFCKLYEKGLISDEKIFYFQVKLSDYKDKFKAGTYSLNTGMKPTDMMKILAGISTTDTGDSE